MLTSPEPMRLDLHCHSSCSDGELQPAQLIAAAAEAGVQVLALTDHDTVAGLEAARTAAAQQNLQLINGVEISVTWERRTLHVVGLGIDPQAPALLAGLARLQSTRRERAIAIGQRLEKLGIGAALQRAEQIAGHAQITRTHYARMLVQAGHCRDMPQAFKRYLAVGKPAHVAVQWEPLEATIDWIHSAGGLAVLAHPLLYRQSAAWRRRMLTAFKAAGGDALEICCGHSSAEQIATSARDALDHQLMGSVGTDYHSPQQRWLKLGRLPPLPAGIQPVWSQLLHAQAPNCGDQRRSSPE